MLNLVQLEREEGQKYIYRERKNRERFRERKSRRD